MNLQGRWWGVNSSSNQTFFSNEKDNRALKILIIAISLSCCSSGVLCSSFSFYHISVKSLLPFPFKYLEFWYKHNIVENLAEYSKRHNTIKVLLQSA